VFDSNFLVKTFLHIFCPIQQEAFMRLYKKELAIAGTASSSKQAVHNG